MADPTLPGRLVSEDGRLALLSMRTQFMSEADSSRVHDEIGVISERFASEDFVIHRSGMPALTASLNRQMIEEIRVLLVLAMLFVFGVMFVIYRHPLALVGPGFVVIGSVLWTFGAMAAVGEPMTMLSNILPAFIVCVGVGDSIHLQSNYRDLRRLGVPNHEAIVDSLSSTGVPMLFTTLTTMFGLLSFRFATIEAVGDLGTQGAFGVAIAFAMTTVCMPIVLSFNTKSLLGASEAGGKDLIGRFLSACVAASGRAPGRPADLPRERRRRGIVLVLALALSVGSLVSAWTLIRVWHD
ncbi:MAG: MMPL family transporter, partial [Myxococcota bacterium]|nr:MMPL family transporter [Myxococcota bacterium]